MKKAACFSVAALDYFPQINQHFAGGNALNQAINFRALGWETAFLGALGAAGSIAIRNGETIAEPALPLEKVIDTTGCGDAFQAGFTAEYIESRDIRKALRKRAELGQTAAAHHGGVPWE